MMEVICILRIGLAIFLIWLLWDVEILQFDMGDCSYSPLAVTIVFYPWQLCTMAIVFFKRPVLFLKVPYSHSVQKISMLLMLKASSQFHNSLNGQHFYLTRALWEAFSCQIFLCIQKNAAFPVRKSMHSKMPMSHLHNWLVLWTINEIRRMLC